jgi:hypothetical protein
VRFVEPSSFVEVRLLELLPTIAASDDEPK